MDPLAKHVAGRLKAQPAQGPHPDAALLSAFAENALPAADRGPLLQHLGACADCREILFLALPESEEAQKVLILKPSWFRRRGLAWGGAVAAVAIAVFFTTERLERKNQMARMVTPASTTRSEAAADIETETGPEKKIAAEAPPPEIDQMQAARESTFDKKAVALDEYASKPQPQAKHMTGKMQAPLDFDRSGEVHLRAPEQSANSLGGAAGLYRRKDNNKEEGGAEKQKENSDSIGVAIAAPTSAGKAEDSAIATAAHAAMRADQAAAGQQAAVAAGTVSPASAPPGVNVPTSSEMVEVEAAAPAIETRSPSTSLSKSKPNATKVGAKGRNFVAALPKWSLSAVGEVQRSLDHGKTWLPAQPVAGVLFRAVASVGQEVWAAGNGGALYHSSDAGLTWSRLTVKAGGKEVQDDITEIDFTDATRGHLRTSAGSDFTTSDAGQTWQIEMAR